MNNFTISLGQRLLNFCSHLFLNIKLKKQFLLFFTFIFLLGINSAFSQTTGTCTPADNPVFPTDCETCIIVVLDESGSIGSINTQMVGALKDFVEVLNDYCLDVNMAIVEYSSGARVANIGGSTTFQDVNDAYELSLATYLAGGGSGASSYNPGGGTNWDQGLQVANTLAASASCTNPYIVMISDGNPTYYGTGPSGPGNSTTTAVLQAACNAANTLKNNGSRIFTVAVPNPTVTTSYVEGITDGGSSLEYVDGTPGSGQTNDIKLADYLVTTSADVGDAFAALAAGIAKPTISTTAVSTNFGDECNPTIPVPNFTVNHDCQNPNPTDIVVDIETSNTGCDYTRTYTANYTHVDVNCGAVANEIVITYNWFQDNEDPVISTDAVSGNLGCNPDVQAPVFTGLDNCDGQFAPNVDDGGGPTVNGCTYSQTWTATYTDTCLNEAQQVQVTYTWVVDDEPPVISTNAQSGDLGCNPDVQAPVFTALDNCDGQFPNVDDGGGPTIDGCNYSQTWTATLIDGCGNQAAPVQVTYTWYQDTIDPVITNCPAEAIDLGDNPTLPTVTDAENAINATDNCEIKSKVAVAGQIVEDGCISTQTFVVTVTDNCDRTATCDVVYTWTKDCCIPPVITCPDNADLECSTNLDTSPSALGTATYTEGCGDVTITHNDVVTPGNCAGYYTITRTWTATDENQDTATCVQTITVSDTTDPVISGVGADGTFECGSAPVFGTPTASDNCDSDVTLQFSDTNGETTCAGTAIIRTWFATDECGNTAAAIQTMTPVDTTDPVISGVGADGTFECGGAPVFSTPTASDNCDSDVTLTFADTNGATTCAGIAIVRTWTAIDDCGNTATASQTMSPVDDELPIITCPADTQLTCGDDTSPANTGSATATDNCDTAPVVTFSDSVVGVCGCGETATITRTWKATDTCGKFSECVQIITVVGFTEPTVSFTALADLCEDAGVQAGLGGGSPIGGVYLGAGVTDDGNGQTYSFDPSAAGVGTYTITYDYTSGDDCDGSASDDVEVFDLPTVTFTAPDDLCIDAGVQAGLGGGSPEGGVYSGAGVTDDGDGMTYSFDPSVAGVGTHSITYTFTNDNGCGGSATDDVVVDESVNAGTDNSDEICDLDSLDLNFYLDGDADDGGSWEQTGGPNNLDISDPDNVNVLGELGIYTFRYTVVSEFGVCPSDFMDLELTLDQSVDAGDDNDDQFCGANPGVDLFSYLDGGVPQNGIWTQEEGLANLNLSDASNVDFPDTGAGQFRFKYTVASAFGVCGTSEMELIIVTDSVANPGTDGSLTICVGDIVTEDQLFGALTGLPDEGGSWSPELAGAGSYTYSIESEGGICGIEESQVIVSEQVIEIVASDAICGELTNFGYYSVNVTTNEGVVTSNFGTVVNINEVNWTIKDIPNGQNVIVTTTTSLGCEAKVEVQAPECACIALDYEYTDVTCFGLDDGTITVNFVPEGATVTINGQPYDANMLYTPGSYTIKAFYEGVDIAECIIEEKIDITEPDLVIISAVGTDVTCYGANDGTITVSNLSAGAVYTIKKNGLGADLSGQTYFSPGLYIVKAFLPQNEPSSAANDGNNRVYNPCESIVLVTIGEPAPVLSKLFTGFGTDVDCKHPEENWIAAKAIGQGQITYTWSLSPKAINNGWGIVDDTAGQVIEIIPGTGSAIYYLNIEDEAGCTSSTNIMVSANCSDNTDDETFQFSLYPNPVKDLLNVKFDNKVDSDVTIEVYNLVGTKMFSNTFNASAKKGKTGMKVDFSRFPSHVYYIKVITKNGTTIKKVVLDK